jgi:hypothetical protein
VSGISHYGDSKLKTHVCGWLKFDDRITFDVSIIGHRVQRDFRGLISLILFHRSECRPIVENWEKTIFDPKTGQKKSLGWQNEKRATPREHVRLINNIFRVVIIYLFITILFIPPFPFFSEPVIFFQTRYERDKK